MGRDIHVVLERKTGNGWEYLDTEFTSFDYRNYPFFDFLNKACERGCPPELKNKKLRPYTNRWEGRVAGPEVIITYDWDTTERSDLHGFGYITLEALMTAIKKYNALWVSADFLDAFLLMGGLLPEGMRVADDAFDEDNEGIAIRVVEEDDLYLRDYVNTGIKDLQQIAAAYGLKPDALRVCFAYDS